MTSLPALSGERSQLRFHRRVRGRRFRHAVRWPPIPRTIEATFMKLWVALLSVLFPLRVFGVLQVLESPTSPLQVNAPSQQVVLLITLENTSDADVKNVTIEK